LPIFRSKGKILRSPDVKTLLENDPTYLMLFTGTWARQPTPRYTRLSAYLGSVKVDFQLTSKISNCCMIANWTAA